MNYCPLEKTHIMSFRPPGEIFFDAIEDFSVTMFLRNDTWLLEPAPGKSLHYDTS